MKEIGFFRSGPVFRITALVLVVTIFGNCTLTIGFRGEVIQPEEFRHKPLWAKKVAYKENRIREYPGFFYDYRIDQTKFWEGDLEEVFQKSPFLTQASRDQFDKYWDHESADGFVMGLGIFLLLICWAESTGFPYGGSFKLHYPTLITGSFFLGFGFWLDHKATQNLSQAIRMYNQDLARALGVHGEVAAGFIPTKPAGPVIAREGRFRFLLGSATF